MHKCSVDGCTNMQKDAMFAMCNTHMMEAIKQGKQEPREDDDSWVHDSDMESRG